MFFFGGNNRVHLGRCITANNVLIKCGEYGGCVMEDNSSFEGLHIETSFGNVTLESECMSSNNIIIRNHDNHHIFDKNSGIRINYSRDIDIGKQGWIGEGVSLLPGARIGCGSIVGEGAVTSSQFPDHVIIAGSPAKVIRENICWSRDNTFYFRGFLTMCEEYAPPLSA